VLKVKRCLYNICLAFFDPSFFSKDRWFHRDFITFMRTTKGGEGMEQEIDLYSEEVSEALKLGIANGKINLDALKHDAEINKQERMLKKHKHEIWKGADGNWYTFVPDDTKPKNRRKVKRRERESLIEYLVQFYSSIDDDKRNITFEKVYREWQEYSENMQLVRTSTIIRRDNDFTKFFDGKKLSQMPIRSINESHILIFLDQMIQEYKGKIGVKAFGNVKSIIAGVFQYAKIYLRVECMLVKELLATYKAPINSFKKINRENQVFMDDEVDMMVSIIKEKYWTSARHVAFLFMLTTGLRVGEMVALKTTDFIMGNKLHVQRSVTKEKQPDGTTIRVVSETTKTDSSNAIIYLSKEAILIYEQLKKIRLLNGDACEWLMSEDGEFISIKKMDKTLRKLCDELGIPERGCHTLRKTYCSYLLELDVSEKIVQKQMRHASIQTTQNHYYFSTRQEREVRKEIDRSSRIIEALGS